MRLCLTVLALAALAGCDAADDAPTLADVPADRRVAFVAVFDETIGNGPGGGPPAHRVVVADIEDPTVFEIISRPDHQSVSPHLSPDGQQVLFGDRTIGPVSAVQFVRYDLRTGRADTLGHVPPGGEVARPILVGLGSPVVWERDGRGFYFTNPTPPFSGKQDVLRFRFADGFFERVRDSGSYGTLAVGLEGSNTLLAFSNDPAAPGATSERRAGIFSIDLDGQILGRVANPHLDYLYESGQPTQQILEASWSEERKLFAYRLVKPSSAEPETYSMWIAVTNLDGTYFRTYALDDRYVYSSPRWGSSSTLFLNREPPRSNDWRDHRVVVLDLENGSVREFANPSTYGAVGMRMPDAGAR